MTHHANQWILMLVALMVLVIVGLSGNVVGTVSFDKNNIISDAEFEDYTSMSQNAIQSFLESKGSALASYQTERAWNKNTNSWGDTTVIPASQIIYEASVDNRLNPKVILTMLHKEQSLIESGNLNGVNLACGYDPGNSYYSGFGKQVWSCAWQLRQFFDSAAVGDELIAVHDGNLPVYPVNRATYALYRYNPSIGDPNDVTSGQGGNYNFWLIYKRYWSNNAFTSIPPLKWPLNGTLSDRTISLDFGADWSFSYCGGLVKKHVGIDVTATKGEDVYAAESGHVKAIPYDETWRYGINIEHSGFTTIYWHVNPMVNVGDYVTKGQKIGTIADLGTNTHLHFGVRKSSYSNIANRGALPQTNCGGDPAFPEYFIDPKTIAYVDDTTPHSAPYVFISKTIRSDSDNIIDLTTSNPSDGSRDVIFRITITNTGTANARVSTADDFANGNYYSADPGAPPTRTDVTVPAGKAVSWDYRARYQGSASADDTSITNTARIIWIHNYYNEVTGEDYGGHCALTSSQTAYIHNPSQPGQGLSADLNCDGGVGPADFAILLGWWGKNPSKATSCKNPDINGDGNVGAGDFAIMMGQWGS